MENFIDSAKPLFKEKWFQVAAAGVGIVGVYFLLKSSKGSTQDANGNPQTGGLQLSQFADRVNSQSASNLNSILAGLNENRTSSEAGQTALAAGIQSGITSLASGTVAGFQSISSKQDEIQKDNKDRFLSLSSTLSTTAQGVIDAITRLFTGVNNELSLIKTSNSNISDQQAYAIGSQSAASCYGRNTLGLSCVRRSIVETDIGVYNEPYQSDLDKIKGALKTKYSDCYVSSSDTFDLKCVGRKLSQ